MFTFTRHEHVILLFIKMRDQMGIKQIALNIAQFFAKGQCQTLQTVGTKVTQRRGVLLFDVIYSIGIKGGAKATGVTSIWHLFVGVSLGEVSYELGLFGVLSFADATLEFVELFHVFQVEVFDEFKGLCEC
jgi:hypothetical protein